MNFIHSLIPLLRNSTICFGLCAGMLIPAHGQIGSFTVDFNSDAASLTSQFRQAADAPVTANQWQPTIGTGGTGGVEILGTAIQSAAFRPEPISNTTSTIDFASADPGSSFTTSADFRFFTSTTNQTICMVGFASENTRTNMFNTSITTSMAGIFVRNADASDVMLRVTSNLSTRVEASFPQSGFISGHWYRIVLIATKGETPDQFSFSLQLLHLGSDGTATPVAMEIGGVPLRLEGTASNAGIYRDGDVFVGFEARKASTANGGITALDNFTFTLSEVELERFDWSAVPELYPGIRHAQVNLTSPRPLRMNVLLVDTAHPDIRFTTTGRHPNWGQAMTAPLFVTFTQPYYIRTGRQRTRDFLIEKRNAGLNAVAAINAAPWRPWAELSFWQSSFAYADKLGLAVSDGVLVDVGNNRPSLVVEKDWTVRMQASPSTTDTSNMLHAVSGFQFALQHGGASGGGPLEPRTGYGLCRDNRFLILMTADGRQNGFSEGLTLTEVGQYLRYFGARTGINMDGGGSTTMVLRDPNTTNINIVNSPSESPRTVGNNLGIYYVDPNAPEQISFTDWLAFRRVPAEQSGFMDDPAGDGIPNLLAYALNIHPLRGESVPGGQARPKYEILESDGKTYLTFDFRRNRHAVGIDVGVELSETLAANSWIVPNSLQIIETGTDLISKDPTYRATVEVTDLPKAFLRLNVAPAQP